MLIAVLFACYYKHEMRRRENHHRKEIKSIVPLSSLDHLQFSGFPGGSDGSVCLQCRRPGFDPWVGNIFLEKEMATHSSTLAWKIPWMEEPCKLQPMGSQRVGDD